MSFSEASIEEVALRWFEEEGWTRIHGPSIAPEEPNAERASFADVLLLGRLEAALSRLNPGLPALALDEAIRRIKGVDGADLVDRNRALHRLLVDGVQVEYRDSSGDLRGGRVQVIDFDAPLRNDLLALNQFSVHENRHSRRPDVVLLVNGIPLVLVELKNPAAEDATIANAFQQLQTYKAELPRLFTYNQLLVISDGISAQIGTLTSGREWFKPWRTIDGTKLAAATRPELEVMIRGVLTPANLLSLVRDFTVFEEVRDGTFVRKTAGYHQFHAVHVAVNETLRATELLRGAQRVSETASGRYEAKPQAGGSQGDRRIGVVWHTQGSGKSLTMVFYAGRVIREPAMDNPTIVVLTDRNDLDDQLFGTFSRCKDLLRQPPVQAESREQLKELLAVSSGGVVFTTIHKFLPDKPGEKYPALTERRNIVVIADEAHRSQYDFIDGYARHMRDALPHASFIGFTGTPIEQADANTRAVFGDYISVYDIQQAVRDKATVPIYYESRYAKLDIAADEKPLLDEQFEEATEGEEVSRKERLKTQWARLEAIVGAEHRVQAIARDLVEHFENRLAVLDGKAMVVCMSRRICIDLYKAIAALRPDWAADADEHGSMKIVMTGSASDPLEWQPHIRTKARREALAVRFRDAKDPFRIVIVRDMWLTGFDAPSLHTMYVDKPMRGHGLMQAIARVNRVFKDKPGGLVVDYLGIADQLRQALATYTAAGGTGKTALNQDEAVALMLEKYEVCCGLYHGFDWSRWSTGDVTQKTMLIPAAMQHILAQEDGKARYLEAVTDLGKAFALSVPHPETVRIRDDLAFFQTIRAQLAKGAPDAQRTNDELEHAIRQIVSKAVVADGVVDIFAAAGIKTPDISILSDEFLAEVRELPHRNLAVELLERLLKGEVTSRRQRNVVQARSFAELLERALRAYQNRAIETAQVIEELIGLAKQMRAADARGEQLGLSSDEVAFYEALETNDSAVAVLGDETLRIIARELVATVRKNVTIDWTVRESVRAQLRVYVKRILRKYGYPPDKQERAAETILEQAEAVSQSWAA